MTGELSVAGDIASGALLARAVEPMAGEGGRFELGLCLNCGTALTGPYCHACGQTGHVHRTLGSIGHDLLHGVFHFEGKIWRTLPMLAFHPGALTRRYIAGERARFVSPLAMFLFTVFLLFATFGALSSGGLSQDLAEGTTLATIGMDRAQTENRAALRRLGEQRAAVVRAGGSVKAIDAKIGTTRADMATFDRLRAKAEGKRGETVTGLAWLDHGIARARANPALVIYKVQSTAYKYSWALIVLSTPLIALLFFWRRRFTLYDHAIFAIYSITFMSLLAIAMEVAILLRLPAALITFGVLSAIPAHMFVQLREAYGLSRFSAAWRTVFLLVFAWTVLTLFVVAIIALGLAG